MRVFAVLDHMICQAEAHMQNSLQRKRRPVGHCAPILLLLLAKSTGLADSNRWGERGTVSLSITYRFSFLNCIDEANLEP